jgi:phage gpG-like protein
VALVVKNTIPDLNKATKRLKKTLPRKIANIAKNHYLEGFRREGRQTDASASGWPARKKKDKQNTRRAILVKTASLKNDVDVRRTTFEEIVLGTKDVAYGEYHNEGTEKMPMREFLGDSKKLDRKILKFANTEFDKEFNR